MQKTVLITGVSGYLGSHVAKEMKKDGWRVVGLDIKHTNNHYLDKFYPIDILDVDSLSYLFQSEKIDMVFHFAGLIDVAESNMVPALYYRTNTTGTINILDVMSYHGVNSIVYSSTAGVYKSQNKQLHEEDEVCPLNNPYAGSKYAAELAIKQSKLNHIIFRYFNLAGADPDGEFGENHEPENHLIPKILRNLNNVEIYGDDYQTPDGTCMRDFVHVSDVANAHLVAAKYLLKVGKSETINLGTGRGGNSVKSIIENIQKLTQKQITVKVLPRRPGDPPYLVSNISLAEKVLNYQPKHDILSILKTAYEWQIKNGK